MNFTKQNLTILVYERIFMSDVFRRAKKLIRKKIKIFVEKTKNYFLLEHMRWLVIKFRGPNVFIKGLFLFNYSFRVVFAFYG